ncbi:DUF3097 domain-containing protein [Streptomyces sp. NPDC089799]|uniref:DUF3097 domain-containing protein n=1 Tax=Streptomyces sp. NPDC089799 TaxID=3155066 RepID=UPI003437586A
MREYSPDLTPAWKRPKPVPEVAAEPDLVVEVAGTDFCGAVVGCEAGTVTLEDRFGKRRVFPLEPRGFLLDGAVVTLVRPSRAPAAPARTASGSLAVPGARARVARAGRIYVEGRHDAELVERVWGDDLRIEGVVVEYLSGIDDLPAIVAEFGPAPDARLGVLVDHLVPGSKESRLAAQVSAVPDVLVVGHPYVDVWQAVKPSALGIPAWPVVPPGQDWKTGVCRALGWPENTGAAWQHVLSRVTSYRDLEPTLLGRVEELIDFVTAPA